ncbi:unnamed protein product [Rotaria sordida]|uniref:G-protein coupled receptors family 1 profile domain-containing protein n=1 Tax=Rotaria sordida TaxID=392033 RepID=A0A814T0R3_9BILA|nr:unnamed protein product [Rotaria sordida]CAF1155158.1 unnamed protein product [Rotaria sordida]CAF3717576.1 unnamed protein product [Rotaria sordida]CAF4098066.1 unnamed protein product [Rotaria sordida]
MISSNSTDHDIDYGLSDILLFRLIVWGYAGMALSIFGIVGNIITILVLMSPSLRTTSTNIYLIALSCSNIIFLLIFVPSYSIRYLLGYKLYMSNQPPFAFEILLSRIPTTPIYNTILLSIIYLTIAVSTDRLILIKFPLKAKHILTKRVTLTTILFIYIFSIVYCIPYWLEQQYVPEVQQCRLTNIGKKIYKYTRIYVYIPVVYFIPFVTLTCINITIIQNLIAKKRQKLSLCGKGYRKVTADYHITLMLVAIIIVFVLCQLPLLVLNAWYAIDPHGSYESLRFHTLNSIGILLTVFNTSTNFLLYCFFGQKFRSTLIQFILKIFSKHSKKFNIHTQTLKQNKLPLKILHQGISTNYSSTTITNDSKLFKIKPIDFNQRTSTEVSATLDQSLTITDKEESHPLLKTMTIHSKDSIEHITTIEEKSQSKFNENQIMALMVEQTEKSIVVLH